MRTLNRLKFPVLFTILCLSASCTIYPSYESIVKSRGKIEPITFEKEKWFDKSGIGVEELWRNRPGLARDLIARNLLIGKTIAEVNEVFGENEIDRFDNSISIDTFIEMGAADPIFIEKLVIIFDQHDKVEKVELKIKMMDGHPDYR